MFALIGETLRRLRKDKRLTLEELGEAAELGRGQLSRIENGRQEATLSTLAKILNAQGVSRREFFRRYDLVESEALAVERQQARRGGAGEGDWPQEIQDVLSRVESFVDADAPPAAAGRAGSLRGRRPGRPLPRRPEERRARPRPAGERRPPRRRSRPSRGRRRRRRAPAGKPQQSDAPGRLRFSVTSFRFPATNRVPCNAADGSNRSLNR